MLRRLIAVVMGIVAGAIIMSLVGGLGRAVWPAPEGVDLKNPEQLRTMLAHLPTGALVAMVAGWALGAFGGGWMAATMTRDFRMALAVGAVILLMVVLTVVQTPHPLWMSALGVLLPLPAAWVGSRLMPMAAS